MGGEVVGGVGAAERDVAEVGERLPAEDVLFAGDDREVAEDAEAGREPPAGAAQRGGHVGDRLVGDLGGVVGGCGDDGAADGA